jgi:hypothetical protein
MKLQAGLTVRLRVEREMPPNGYILSGADRNVLLHYSQVAGSIQVGQEVEVFLHHDTQDRLAATMKRPLLAYGEVKVLKVADVHPRLGCFLDIGLDRHLLLPAGELPDDPELRPQVGDEVPAMMKRDRQGRLIAAVAGEKELASLVFAAPTVWKNRWVDCTVYKPLKMGTFVLCDGGVVGFGVLGFIHASERKRPLRLGERLQARVTHVREDGRVNLSMHPLKEVGRVEDAERILAYLQARPGGTMPYSDDTPPEIIQAKFGISKSAFKRALGKLLKEGRVEQRDGWTALVPATAVNEKEHGRS